MTPSRRVLMLLALLALLAACRTGVTGSSWQSPVGREHQLVGRIWDVAAGRFVDEATLTARIAHARYVTAMIAVQRARDAQMAEALLTAASSDGAVLIAGAGHVRNDRDVPAYVRRIAPGVRTASVAFLEVDPERQNIESYAARFEHRLPFDYVWFTPAVDDEDPCEKFRKPLERMGR